MSNTPTDLEKRLARFLSINAPLTAREKARPRVDLAYLKSADQERLRRSLLR